MIKTKVIDSDEFCNLVFDNFSFEIIYYPKILFEVLIFLNSKFELFKQSWVEKWPKQKLWIPMNYTTLMLKFSFEII
jgi:hypothetical protein